MISLDSQFRLASLIGVAVLLAVPGCGGKKTAGKAPDAPATGHANANFADLSKEAPDVLGAPKAPPPSQGGSAWSIVIVSAAGETMEQESQLALEKVRTKGGLPTAYSERRGKTIVVAYGKYPGPDTKEAQEDLKRIKTMRGDGGTPSAGAILAPPPYESLPGSVPEYDLSTLKKRRGKNAMYTLQFAAYTRMDR